MNQTIWENPQIVSWNQYLLNSYYYLLGHQLIERNNDPTLDAKDLFFAPFVVASHGIEDDPILNYGNQTALNLWEMSWGQFTQTPSRQTAEVEQRERREQMLKTAKEKGYFDNYQGIRISGSGKRFYINQAIIWNIFDEQKNRIGQAATFSQWQFIDA